VDVAALKTTMPGWAADPRYMIEAAAATLVPGSQFPRQARFGVKSLF
jgi:hypothetical protein